MVFDLSVLENLGFPQILLWLLTFAVLYGVLSQAGKGGIPKSKGARTIISMVIAFFVMISAPANFFIVLSEMSGGLIIFLIALLVFIVFLETAGIKSKIKVPVTDKEGNVKIKTETVSIFEKHSTLFLIVFIIIALLIFVSSGGLSLLGVEFNLNIQNNYTIIFLIVIMLAIVWLVANPE
ncbi:MAG: hypothetical protein J7K26_03395 [Candidatus Aenigmarchaeota archaeon]|nr:hypothetical protein [Candidatus Aenigmarchaeota archaeon]